MQSGSVLLLWLALLFVIHVRGTNGQRCGTCGSGEERERSTNALICGRCVPVTTTCATGYYRDEGTCHRCPCHLSNIACSKDSSSGQVICSCPSGYSGAKCDRCIPGYKQESNYPYRCIATSPGGNTPPVRDLPKGCPDARPRRECPIGPRPECPARECPIGPRPECPTRECPIGPRPEPECPARDCGNNCPQKCPSSTCGTECNPSNGCGNNGACGNGNGNIPCNPGPCDPNPCNPTSPCNPRPDPGPCNPTPTNPTPTNPTYPCNIAPCNDPCPGKCDDPCPGGCADPCPSRCGDPCPGDCADPCPGRCPDPCPRSCGDPCPSTCSDPCPRRCSDPCPGRCSDPCPSKCENPCPTKCNITCTGTCGCEGGGLSRVDPCLLECDPRGTYRAGAGMCICKQNVEGAKCDSCKPGYFGLQTGNNNGCSKCFCSGVTTSCSSSIFYRSTQSIDCRGISLVDTVGVKTQPSSATPNRADYSFGSRSGQYYWVLPATVTGNLLTAYGGKLVGFREYSSSSTTASVPGDDVIIEGANGVSLFWSTSSPTPSGSSTRFEVQLDEFQGWMTWRNKGSNLASRTDILSVLAHVKRVLVRASFTPSGMTRSTLSNFAIGFASDRYTGEGFTFRVEDCQCPTGYQGHSCESCQKGYYRDVTDTTTSIFGSCKLCPCGNNADGCKLIFGLPQCVCKAGYSGPRCEDRDSCTISLNPCRVRDCIDTTVQFECRFTSSSSKAHRVTFSTEPPMSVLPPITTSPTGNSMFLNLTNEIRKVVCELHNTENNELVAVAYSKLEPQDCKPVSPPPMGPSIRVIAEPKFRCVEEGSTVQFNCTAWSFASSMLTTTWTRSGKKPLPRGAGTSSTGLFTIKNVQLDDTGTYYCAAGANVIQVDYVNLVVKKTNVSLGYPFHEEVQDAPFVLAEPNAITVSSVLTAAQVSISPPVLDVVVGEVAEFKCTVHEEREGVEVYWRRQDAPIALDVAINGSRITFNPVQMSHAGSYYCIFSDELRKSNAKAVLNVHEHRPSPPEAVQKMADAPVADAPPEAPAETPSIRISTHPAAHLIKHGDNVTLSCAANVKDTEINWQKEDSTIKSSARRGRGGRLLLPLVDPEDSGWYICFASTSSGEKFTGKIFLNIKPVPVTEEGVVPTAVISPSSPHHAKLGHKVRLECQTTGEPSPIVKWSRYVNTVDGEMEQTLLEAQTPNAAFEIRRATKAHQGEYFCTAMNSAGTYRASIQLVMEEGIQCESDQFPCHSADQCIPLGDRCDGEMDCKDGSDERHCTHKRHAHRH